MLYPISNVGREKDCSKNVHLNMAEIMQLQESVNVVCLVFLEYYVASVAAFCECLDDRRAVVGSVFRSWNNTSRIEACMDSNIHIETCQSSEQTQEPHG